MTGLALDACGVDDTREIETVRMADARSSVRRVAVVGQGIDGVTTALRIAQAGYTVVGIDTDADRIRPLAQGKSPTACVGSDALRAALRANRYIPTTDFGRAAGFETAVVTVPARHLSEHETVSFLQSAAGCLAPHLRRGATVVVGCAQPSSAVEQIVVPLLEAGSGLKAGRDFAFGVGGGALLGRAGTASVRADIVAADPQSASAIGAFVRTIAPAGAVTNGSSAATHVLPARPSHAYPSRAAGPGGSGRWRPSGRPERTQIIPKVSRPAPLAEVMSPTQVITRVAPPAPPVRRQPSAARELAPRET